MESSTKYRRKTCGTSKKDHANRRRPLPLTTSQSRKVCSDRIPSANGTYPSELHTRPLTATAGLHVDQAKITRNSTFNLPRPTTLSNNHDANFSSSGSVDSSSSSSLGSASSQETDPEDDVSCTSSASLTDPHSLPTSDSTSPIPIKIGRKRIRSSLKPCTVDVVRCKKSVSSSPTPAKPVTWTGVWVFEHMRGQICLHGAYFLFKSSHLFLKSKCKHAPLHTCQDCSCINH